MEPGQYLDTWGARMNGNVIDLFDDAIDGVEDYTLSGSKTLTNNNGAADEARKRVQNITGGTGGTITIPNVEKWYLVRNNSSADVTFTTGSGTTTAVKTGAIVPIFCDGANAVYQAIRPDFGSANVSTTGTLTAGAATLTSAAVTNAVTASRVACTDASGEAGNFIVTSSNNIAGRFEASHGSYASFLLRAAATRAGNSAYSFLVCTSSKDGAADVEFSVNGVGTVSSDGGTAMSTPADYADMMEWADGNPDGEDRIGYSVVLVGEKVRKATAADKRSHIIGIASGNPSVCGGAAWNRWSGKYLVDDFNRNILDENGDRVVNEFYDPAAPYTPRAARTEWDPIGLCGRISLRKGCPTNPRWRKMRDISATVEEWLVR